MTGIFGAAFPQPTQVTVTLACTAKDRYGRVRIPGATPKLLSEPGGPRDRHTGVARLHELVAPFAKTGRPCGGGVRPLREGAEAGNRFGVSRNKLHELTKDDYDNNVYRAAALPGVGT
jgi:hypothetical protein